METKDIFSYLVNDVHRTVVATVDAECNPITTGLDLLDYDETGLYFLTGKAGGVCTRLGINHHIALTSMGGTDTSSTIAVTIRGLGYDIGPQRLERLFEKNPAMRKLFPTEESKESITVIHICKGTGEWLDLTKTPFEKVLFAF